MISWGWGWLRFGIFERMRWIVAGSNPAGAGKGHLDPGNNLQVKLDAHNPCSTSIERSTPDRCWIRSALSSKSKNIILPQAALSLSLQSHLSYSERSRLKPLLSYDCSQCPNSKTVNLVVETKAFGGPGESMRFHILRPKKLERKCDAGVNFHSLIFDLNCFSFFFVLSLSFSIYFSVN